MLRFIYVDELNITPDNAIELMAISGLYNLERMQSICMQFIEETVDLDSVISLLEVADWYEALHLRSFCVTFIMKNFRFISTLLKHKWD